MPFVITPTPTQPGDTFLTLLTEFYLRGYDYLNDGSTGAARAKRWINQSYQEVAAAYPWSFLETTLTGAAPQTLPLLNTIITVVDTVTGAELEGNARQTLIDDVSSDLTLTGYAAYWYLEDQTLRVYPVSTNILSIRYVYTPNDLALDADVSVVPIRYSNIIIDLAVAKALTDSDNLMAAYAVRSAAKEQIGDMIQNEAWRGEYEHTRLIGYAEDS